MAAITASKSNTIGCVKAAADIIGDKWTPQLLRFFANDQNVRFCQLQDAVGGINPRTLSARLATLESHEIIEKIATNSPSRCEYRLTDKGTALLPIVRDMEQWSTAYGAPEA